MNALVSIPAVFAPPDRVAPHYAHRDKSFQAHAPLRLGSALLKWYELSAPEQPVTAATRELARAFLTREHDAGRSGLDRELGLALLHRCGESFHFLLIATWRNENELWESVYAKDTGEDFESFAFSSTHRGTFCVWELAVVWHEQQAWKRYLRSARDEAARAAWLEDLGRGIA